MRETDGDSTHRDKCRLYIDEETKRLLSDSVLTIRPDDRTLLFSALAILISTRISLSTDMRRVKCGATLIDVSMAVTRCERIEGARAMHDGSENARLNVDVAR